MILDSKKSIEDMIVMNDILFAKHLKIHFDEQIRKNFSDVSGLNVAIEKNYSTYKLVVTLETNNSEELTPFASVSVNISTLFSIEVKNDNESKSLTFKTFYANDKDFTENLDAYWSAFVGREKVLTQIEAKRAEKP